MTIAQAPDLPEPARILYGRVHSTSKDGIMAIVLMEEVLMGLDEVKDSLDQAVATLGDIIEDMSPALSQELQDRLESSFLDPLLSQRDALGSLIIRLAADMD
jgi:hypothetical protein